MRFRLCTLMLFVTATCMLCGWQAYLHRMAAFHRGKAGIGSKAEIGKHPLISEHPSILLAVPDSSVWKRPSYHSITARDFDYALFRPWLAFVHCKPGSTFGAPAEKVPIVKRLVPRADVFGELDY